jgi:hypothetical protein
MWHFSRNCQGFRRLERDHKKVWKSLTGLKHAKGFLQRPLPEELRTIKTKQKPVMVHDRTAYRTLPPERTLFKMGLTKP